MCLDNLCKEKIVRQLIPVSVPKTGKQKNHSSGPSLSRQVIRLYLKPDIIQLLIFHPFFDNFRLPVMYIGQPFMSDTRPCRADAQRSLVFKRTIQTIDRYHIPFIQNFLLVVQWSLNISNYECSLSTMLYSCLCKNMGSTWTTCNEMNNLYLFFFILAR